MCPVCIATAAMIAGSATGTGGLTAIVATTIFRRKKQEKFPNQIAAKEVDNVNDGDRGEASQGGVAQ